jgi:hypothetical protein
MEEITSIKENGT